MKTARFKLLVLMTLLMLITVSAYQKTIVSNANITFPFEMPFKSFILEVLEYNYTIFEYGNVKCLSLDMAYGSHPMGTIYYADKKAIYVALYPERSYPEYVFGVAEINIPNNTLKIYRFPWEIDENYTGPCPWTLAVDDYGKLWISINGYCVTPYHPPELIPNLAKLETETANLTIYYIPKEMGGGLDIKYYNGSVWYMTTYGLSRISLDGVIEEFYPRDFGGFMKLDGDSFWLSSASGGFVTRFNITTKSFDINVTGLDSPMGIEVDEKYVYVAENKEDEIFGGTVARIDKTTLEVIRFSVDTGVAKGPYFVLKDSYGYLWFTTNDLNGKFGIVGGITWYNIIYARPGEPNPYDYFEGYSMTEVPANPSEIWFSCVGSAYMGMKDTGTLGKADLNLDGRIDIKDVATVSKAYGSYPGHPSWNPQCDLNEDGVIDIKDVATVSRQYGKTL